MAPVGGTHWARGPPALAAQHSAEQLPKASTSRRVQAQLELSRPSDPDEREAESFADRIVRSWHVVPAAAAQGTRISRVVERVRLHRTVCTSCKQQPEEDCDTCRVNRLQRKAASSREEREEEPQERRIHRKQNELEPRGLALVSPTLQLELERSSGGARLPAVTRARFEAQFGADFGAVRLHTGPRAARLNQQLNARAFTYGHDIYFAPGQYQPSSGEGVRLLAHELTHVVQQGGAVQHSVGPAPQTQLRESRGPLIRQETASPRRLQRALALPSIGDAMAALQSPATWVREQLVGLVTRGLRAMTSQLPSKTLDEAKQLFGALAARGADVLQALRKGDCQPLFRGLGELRDLIRSVGSEAWVAVTEFLEPKVALFRRLWGAYSAEPLAALKELGGDAWTGLQDLWAGITEVGGAAGHAIGEGWAYVKGALGAQADKPQRTSALAELAARAWESVKEQTRPVWQPIAALAERIGALAPPAFLADLGKRCAAFGQSLQAAHQGLAEGGGVAENRAALVQALPSLDLSLEVVEQGLELGRSVTAETVRQLGASARGFMKNLRSADLFSALADAFSWVDQLITQMEGWAHEGLAGFFGMLLAGLGSIKPLMRNVLEVAKAVGSVLLDVYSLPVKLLGKAWDAIPECLRAPVQQFIVEQILARIPLFTVVRQGAADAWERLEKVGLRLLRQVFVERDLPKALWTFFQELLHVLGIPEELVVQLVVKASGAFGDILQDPLRFLGALLSGLVNGFVNFGGNILGHLKQGILSWLAGACAEAELELPREFTASSVFAFVAQTLDITVEHFFERMAAHPDIGPEVVAKLRHGLAWAGKAWDFIEVLNNEGMAGLGRLLQEKVSGLWELVLGGATDWINTKVIQRLLERLALAAASGPIGPIVNAVVMVYEGIQTARKHKQPILAMVDRSLDAMGETAKGNPAPAASIFEQQLANAIPIAIDFIAGWLGLGDLGDAIRGIFETLKEKVTAAMDWLIAKALQAGRAVLDTLRRAASAVRSWLDVREPVTPAGGEPHTLFIDGKTDPPVVMMESDPTPYRTFVENQFGDKRLAPDKQKAKAEAMKVADELDKAIADAWNEQNVQGSKSQAKGASAIPTLASGLAQKTAMLLGKPTPTVPKYGPLKGGFFGTAVFVERLAEPSTKGTKPTTTHQSWCHLNQRRHPGGSASFYVRGHLLNHHLGGPGGTFDNLAPLVRQANSDHLHNFESAVKTAVLKSQGGSKIVQFIVTAKHGGARLGVNAVKLENPGGADVTERQTAAKQVRKAEKSVPSSLECSATTPGGEVVAKATIVNEIEQGEPYNITPDPDCKGLPVDGEDE
jgi:hypothetical protein